MENMKIPSSASASSSSSSRADRKTIERNRRNQMKELYSHLCSLLPPPPHQTTSREPIIMSMPDQLEEAARYIKKLQTNVERMKERKEGMMMMTTRNERGGGGGGGGNRRRRPRVEVRESSGSGLEVVLVTGSGSSSSSVFSEMIRVVEEEGWEVVNASFSVAHQDLVFHTIHSKAGDGYGVGCGAAMGRISERLKKLVEGYA